MILASSSSTFMVSIFDLNFAFLLCMSVINPIWTSWKVPFFYSSCHSYWKIFRVLSIPYFYKKLRIKSSITTSLFKVFGTAATGGTSGWHCRIVGRHWRISCVTGIRHCRIMGHRGIVSRHCRIVSHRGIGGRHCRIMGHRGIGGRQHWSFCQSSFSDINFIISLTETA